MNNKLIVLIVGVIAFILITYFFISQQRRIEKEKQRDVTITMERGPCYGLCPVYSLKITGDGEVVYEGSDHTVRGDQSVKEIGTRNSTISKNDIDKLIAEFEEIDYYNLEDSYENYDYSDAKTVITSITLDGEFKQITHYHGDTSAPKELSKLEDKIDELTNSDQWVY